MSTTPHYGHGPIKMHRKQDQQLQEIGDFKWNVGGLKRTLEVMIPESSEKGMCWSRWTVGHPNAEGDSWGWDCNEDLPTLTPSLHAIGVWHGHVRNGYLVEA